ncbi:MAG: hypothetical protein HC788_09330 [Sphingopyxis sp.]|nr:hypothetical protein [Sphingopyxis sp.]
MESGCDAFGPPRQPVTDREAIALAAAIHALTDRKSRRDHFANPNFFGEPAWDILLDLYIHQVRNQAVTVRSTIIGSGASSQTAMRWLEILEAEDLIRSEHDPGDANCVLLRLTAEGYEGLTRYFETVAR